MNLISIVHDLRRAQGRNAKMGVLLREQNNDQWKRCLQYMYDSRKAYHITAPSSMNFDSSHIDDQMFEIFDKLESRKISGKSAKTWATTLSNAYGEIPRLILGHSLKAGVSITSINNAYPGLIFQFKTMKGKDIPIPRYPILSSIKFDGVKIFTEVTDNSTKFMTSSGAIFYLDSLEDEFKWAVKGMYEGELIHKLGRQVDRPVITGHLNSLLSGTISDISSYSYMIYDYLMPYEWKEKRSTNFKTRNKHIEAMFDVVFQDSAYVKLVEQTIHETEEEMMKFNEDLILRGYEGSMHRYPEDHYEWTGEKRTDALIKKKSIRECILTCHDTVPHSNQLKGVTGSLLCEGHIKDKIAGNVYVTAKAGALNKMEIMREREYWIGKEVEILYNSVTTTNSGHSLFLPRYKRIEGEL